MNTFTAPEAAQLAGCTYRQIRHWADLGYLHPAKHQMGQGRHSQWALIDVLRARAIRVAGAGLPPGGLKDISTLNEHELVDQATITVSPRAELTLYLDVDEAEEPDLAQALLAET